MKKIFKTILKLMIAVIVIIAVKTGADTVIDIMYPLRYEEEINIYSEKYALDRYLVMGVIKAESNYIHDAHSGVASGLMQITDSTAEWIAEKLNTEYKPEDIKKPSVNINMGCYYLAYLSDRYSDTDTALAAYNGGMGNVDKWLENKDYSQDGKTLFYIPFPETREYVKRVNKYRAVYEKLYGDKE